MVPEASQQKRTAPDDAGKPSAPTTEAEAPPDKGAAAKQPPPCDAAKKTPNVPEKRSRTPRQFVSDIKPFEEIILQPEGDVASMKVIGVKRTEVVTYVRGYLKRIVIKRIQYLDLKTGKIVIATLPHG